MRKTRQVLEGVTGVCSILVLAGSLWCFVGVAEAGKPPRNRFAAGKADTHQSGHPGQTATDGKEAVPTNQASPAPVSYPAAPSPAPALSQPATVAPRAVMPRPAAVALPASPAVTRIQISFKVDPRLPNSLPTREGWVSPPISINTGAPESTTPTVEARADVLDAKGHPVDVHLEWVPADPEMVTVSPGQGNEVEITVHYAGQSSLQVTSQKASKQLAIMAWYQDGAIRAEISEKP